MAKLYFRFSAMNGGKTMSLLQAAFSYEELGKQVSCFTPIVDDRAGIGRIESRIGKWRDATAFGKDTEFNVELTGRVSCVFIDEAQFCTPEQVRQLHRLANLEDIPVICYGLRSDFRGEAFPGSAALLTLADDLEELKAVCGCERKATMNMRIDENGRKVVDGPQVSIGGNDRYRPVCAACYYRLDLVQEAVEQVEELAVA